MKCSQCGRQFLLDGDLENPPTLCATCITKEPIPEPAAADDATPTGPTATIVRPMHQLHIKFKGNPPPGVVDEIVSLPPRSATDQPAPLAEPAVPVAVPNPPLPAPTPTSPPPDAPPPKAVAHPDSPVKYRLRPAKFEASVDQIAAAGAIVRHRRHRRRLAWTIALLLLALLVVSLAAIAYLRRHPPTSQPNPTDQAAGSENPVDPTALTLALENRANQTIIVKVGNQVTSLQAGEQRTLPLRFGTYDVSWTTVLDGDTVWDNRANERLDSDRQWIFTADLSGPTPRLLRTTADPTGD